MKQITQWSIINDKEDKLEFNHIEDGWSCRDKPLGIYVNQKKKWKNLKWHKDYGYINSNYDNKVIIP